MGIDNNRELPATYRARLNEGVMLAPATQRWTVANPLVDAASNGSIRAVLSE